MGKKIKVKKEPSEFLLKLIDEANDAIRLSQKTIKEKLLYVYNQAIEEGYNPKGARKLMTDTILDVSSRYITEVLPPEAKQIQDHSRQNQLKNIPAEGVPPENLNTISETATPQTPPTITLGATQEDIDAINKMKDEEEEEEETTPTKVEPSLDEKMTMLSHENFKLEEQLKEANDTILRLQKELDTAQQLLREERAKNAELKKQLHELERYKRLEQIRLEAQRKSLESWKVPGERPT